MNSNFLIIKEILNLIFAIDKLLNYYEITGSKFNNIQLKPLILKFTLLDFWSKKIKI